MPSVLKVKVDGVWVPAVAAPVTVPNEVAIQPAEPGADAELWYDSDDQILKARTGPTTWVNIVSPIASGTLDGLLDVDTTTVIPVNNNLLVYNQSTSIWRPLDGTTLFLSKAGGTLTGPLTAPGFTGSGSGLTDLNGTAITSGTISATRLPTTVTSDTTGSAAKLTTPRSIALGGDLTGSVLFDGSANVTLTATIAANSVALGAETTGNYTASVIGTTNQVIVNGVTGEGSAYTLSTPQNIDALATPTFARLTLSQVSGLPPMTIQSTTKVPNLNADRLDDQEGDFYREWANILTKPDPTISLTLTGPVQGSATKLWTDLAGNVDLSIATTMPGGAGSNIDADKLDGFDSTYFMDAANLTSGTLSSGRLTGTYTINIIGTVTGNVIGNANTATKLQTPTTIAGKSFDGSTAITLSLLTRGTYLTGANYDGSAATTWAVDATSANTASKVVARDASGNFFANEITASRLHSSIITGTPPLSVISNTMVPNLNVEKFQGYVPSDFATREEVEALLGDLRLVGAYDAASYTGSWASMPPSRILSRMSGEPMLLDAHNVVSYANLITNPGFTGTAVGGIAPGWAMTTYAGTVASTAQSIGTTDVRVGDQWQRMTGTYDTGDCRVLHPAALTYATVPGTTYRIVATMRGTIPANVSYRLAFRWSSDAANTLDLTNVETTVTTVATYWNTFTVVATAPAIGGAFCSPQLRVYGTGAAVAATVDVFQMEFMQAPELKNTGQAGNAVMMGTNTPVLHPDSDDSFFWFPAVTGNNLSWVFPGTTADPSLDIRGRVRRDSYTGIAGSRFWNGSPYFQFTNETVTVIFMATDATQLSIGGVLPASAPRMGEWIDLRGSWNTTTDVVTLYWRDANSGSVTDDTGWNLLSTSTTFAGKMVSEATRTFTHGSGDSNYNLRGGIKQIALFVNDVLNCHIDARSLTDPSVTSFVCATGQTITINRTGVIPTQLIPSRFYDGRSVVLLSTGNYLSVADHASLNFSGTESMSALLTMRQSSTPTAFARYLYKYGPAGATPGYMISPNSPITQQRAILEVPATSTASRTMSAAADRVKRTWGMVLDRTSDLLYLSENATLSTGVAVADGVALSNTGPLFFGVGANGTSSPANYEFMSALMVRSALSTAELQELSDTVSRGSDLYQHATYWVCSSPGTLDYIDSDWSLRYEITDDDTVDVFNGDWILCFDPLFNEPGHEVGTWHPRQDMVFQYVPFSAETYVKSVMADHVAKADPHDQYVLWTEGITSFAPFSHGHPDEIAAAITVHEGKADPHEQYLREVEASALYMPIGTNFDQDILDQIRVHEEKTDPHQQYLLNVEADARYEVIGSVTAHEAKSDPHPIYLTASEGDSRYDVAGKIAEHEAKPDPHPQYLNQIEGLSLFASLIHYHDDRYYQKTEVDALFNIRVEDEVYAVDVAQSARVAVGGTTKPSNPAIGDLFVSAPPADQKVPGLAAGFSFVATSPTSITTNWSTWPASATITSIQLEWNNASVWTAVTGSPFAPSTITYLDTTAITENLVRQYRIRAINAIDPTGASTPWSTTLVANSANAAPPFPTGLVGSAATPTSVVLTWTAPTWSDPGASGARYEVFLNGVSVGFAATTAVTYTFTGLTENTQYTLGVRSKDAGGLTSTLATLNSAATKTTNAAPVNAPTAPTATASTTMPSVSGSWTAPTLPADYLNYEAQVVQTSNTAVLQTKTTTATSVTFDEVAWGLQVFVRVRVMDALGAGSAYANSANVTTRIHPTVTMGTPTVVATDLTITWTAPPTQVTDFTSYTLNEYDGPSGTTVLRTFAKGSALTHTFDDMPYGVSRRYAVKVERSGALATVVSGYSASVSAIADPIPTTLVVSATGNAITVTWGAPTAGEPADSTVYRVRLWIGGGVSTETTVAYNATQSATFSGLAYATAYQADVRLERSNLQHSSYTSLGSVTTGVNPDTTPPASITPTSLKPEGGYGVMVARFTLAPEPVDYLVQYSTDGTNYVNVGAWTNASASQAIVTTLGTFSAGQVVRCRVWQRDKSANQNARYNDFTTYTLAASPTYVSADATNYWRSTNSGEYNAAGNYKLHQGYYSISSYNAVGFLYYGTKISAACAGKTVWAMNMFLHREGGGINQADMITLYMHDATSSPGTVAFIGASHPLSGSGHDWGTLIYGEYKWLGLSAQMVTDLAAGVRRGIALYRSSGKPYMFLYALSAQAAQGQLAIYHYG